MKPRRRRKCLHCLDLFRPDPRNLRHQRYCSKAGCRQASKAASQRRWLNKGENRDYFRGAVNVQRVQAWREAHPGYSKRTALQDNSALQDDSLAQATEVKGKSGDLAAATLQDLLSAQPLVLIGLIAHLTNSALQEDIAQTGRRLQQLGQDIVFNNPSDRGTRDAKTTLSPFTGAPGPTTVQLGGSSSGA